MTRHQNRGNHHIFNQFSALGIYFKILTTKFEEQGVPPPPQKKNVNHKLNSDNI